MVRIAIVTDSAANIPMPVREGKPLSVVPIHLILENRSLLDEVDMTSEEFYRWFAEHPKASLSTSCPSPGEFLETYSRVGSSADGIVSIHTAGSLSTTYSSAVQGADLLPQVGSKPPQVRVVDSRTVSMGCGFCVLAASRAAEQGKEIDEVVSAAQRVAGRVKLFAVLATLRYVVRSGRVPSLAQALAGRAPIFPVLQVGEGRVRVADVALSRTQAVRRLRERVLREAAGRPLRLSVLHGGVAEAANDLAEALVERCDCRQLVVTQFTPVMGAHTGPGLLGAAFYAAEDDEPQDLE